MAYQDSVIYLNFKIANIIIDTTCILAIIEVHILFFLSEVSSLFFFPLLFVLDFCFAFYSPPCME